MVSPERQAAANRAELAMFGQKALAWAAGVASVYAYISIFTGMGPLGALEGLLLDGVALGLKERASSNMKRSRNMRNPEILDDDPRVSQLRRNYRQEIPAGIATVKEFPSLIRNRLRRVK